MISLNEEQVKQIEGLIGEMPGRYAIALLNILNKAAQEKAPAVQPETTVKK
jgi:hypothetical protein